MEQAPDRLPGLLLGVTLAAVALALPLSLLLLALYRRAVVRAMRRSSGPTVASAPRAAPVPDEGEAMPADARDELAATPSLALDARAQRLFAAAWRRPWRTAAVHAAGGLAYAVVMATAWAWEPGALPSALQIATLGVHFAWPAALAALLVAASTRRDRAAVLAGYALALLASGGVALAASRELRAGQLAGLWLLMNGPASLFLLAFWNARVRAVGPLVLLFLLVAVLGSQVVIGVLADDEARLRPVVDVGFALGLGAGATFAALLLLGFVAFAPIAWLLLRAIRRRYTAKALDDQSLALHALWLLFAATQSIPLSARGRAWLLVAPAAFLARTAVVTGLRRAAAARPSASARLLLLRVFALGRRSERLFARLERHWRHVGSIQLIAGPDLATRTIEPHELLEFVTGRLRRLVVADAAALERRIASLDLAPDRDGRFRVNDLLCQEDTWRPALTRLVRASDAILMDLRGFGPAHAGCAHELHELVAHAPLDRVVLVVDATTDGPFLERTLAAAWRAARADPTARAAAPSDSPPRLTVLHASGADADLAQALRCLCRAAARQGSGVK